MPVPGGTKAGKISKPYGLRGEVNIILNPVAGKKIDLKDPLFIEIDGQRVPFFMEEFDPISDDQAIIKFEFINSLEEAREICGCHIFLDQKYGSGSEVQEPDLAGVISYEAYDQQNDLLGTVAEYVHNEYNPVLIVDYKGKELMVPAVNEIIRQIDHRKRTIHFDLPEGLTEL